MFSPKPMDAPEEHKIELPGLSLAFNHTLKLVLLVDQTGTTDTQALKELEAWINSAGYFLHCVQVEETPDAHKPS